MAEPTEADRERAFRVWAGDDPHALPTDPDPDLDQPLINDIAQALADERERAREQIAESIREAWQRQCAGYESDTCESCRAYRDAIDAAEGAGQ